MKQFKKIDCIIQLVLLIAAITWNLAGISHGDFMGNAPFIGSYFAVGGWQLVSVIVHMVRPHFNKKIPRRIYLGLLLAVLISAVISYLQGDAVLMFFYVLLFAAPAMAVYYCIVCIVETKAVTNTERFTEQA